MVSSYFVSVLGRETLEDHSQLPKSLTNAALGRLQAFRMYGGIGMSVSSLYIESLPTLYLSVYIDVYRCRPVYKKLTTFPHAQERSRSLKCIAWNRCRNAETCKGRGLLLVQ